MIPKELCNGSCNGKRENCPAPQACGWPEYEDEDKGFLRSIVFIVTMLGLIIFCVGVLTWR